MSGRTEKHETASRKNGAKGKGPTTRAGKNAIRLNALKDGLFAKEIVLKGIGEREEDYHRLEKEIVKDLRPQSKTARGYAYDFAEHRWRLLRARRAKGRKLQMIFSGQARDRMEHLQKLRFLMSQFLTGWENYLLLSRSGNYPAIITMTNELAETRRQLATTSDGLSFLIDNLKRCERLVRSKGSLSLSEASLMLFCWGSENELARKVFEQTIREERSAPNESAAAPNDRGEKSRALATQLLTMTEDFSKEHCKKRSSWTTNPQNESAGNSGAPIPGAEASRQTDASPPPNKGAAAGSEASSQPSAEFLADRIAVAVWLLKKEKEVVKCLEEREEQSHLADAILESEGSDQYSRAETTLERRMNRALGMFFTVQRLTDVEPSIPPFPDFLASKKRKFAKQIRKPASRRNAGPAKNRIQEFRDRGNNSKS